MRGPMPGDAAAALTTDATSYAAGAPVTVRMVNRARVPIQYNLCSASLDRNIDEDWRPVRQLGEVCTAELRTLRPGQSVSYSFRLGRELRRGEYRIRLNDGSAGRTQLAVSNSFRLEGNDSD